MNLLNYASLEASKRLVDAGIVLETDFAWQKEDDGFSIGLRFFNGCWEKDIPAPSMAEVWRELPGHYTSGNNYTAWLELTKDSDGDTTAKYWSKRTNINPTDALIDLLLFIKSYHREEDMNHHQMNRDKDIAKALGLCWHEITGYVGNDIPSCSCGENLYGNTVHKNPDFTSDAGKVQLLREMMKREDFYEFMVKSSIGIGYKSYNWIGINYILDTAGKLRDAAWEWLYGKSYSICTPAL